MLSDAAIRTDRQAVHVGTILFAEHMTRSSVTTYVNTQKNS